MPRLAAKDHLQSIAWRGRSQALRRQPAASGVGEVSLGPTAGAIANAVANAFGVRIRELPFTRAFLWTAALEAE